jgi:hypothetical protein
MSGYVALNACTIENNEFESVWEEEAMAKL